MKHRSRPEQFQANVLVVPLLADSSPAFQQPILAAREALERGILRILETTTVRSLIVEITEDVVVLLPEHEILEGGGQNRTPAGSFLLGRGTHEVPVYCVERNRWNPERGQLFHSMGFQLPLPVRRAKLKARLSGRPASPPSYEQLRAALVEFLQRQEQPRAEEMADFILERSLEFVRSHHGEGSLSSLPRFLPRIPRAWLSDVIVAKAVQTFAPNMEVQRVIRRTQEIVGFLQSFLEGSASSDFSDDPQGQVWETIEGLLRKAKVESSTRNVGDLYAEKEAGLRVLVETFPQLEGQCGVMVFIRGHLRGIEWVASPRVWRLYHKPVLAGYFVDNFSGEAKPVTWEEVSRLRDAFMEQISSKIPVNLAQERASGRKLGAGHPFVLSQEGLFQGVGEALFYEDQPYAASVLALDV